MWFSTRFLLITGTLSALTPFGTALASGPFRDTCEAFESEMITSLRPLKKCLDQTARKENTPQPSPSTLCKSQNDAFLEAQVKYHACRAASSSNQELPREK